MDKPPEPLTEEEKARHEALLGRLDRFAALMDSKFQVPGTGLRFGLDGLIGLVPVVGDFMTTGLGLYLYTEAVRIGVPSSIRRRIATNIALDFLVGLVPVAGDALDFFFKANLRNAELLREYSQVKLGPPPQPEGRSRNPLVWVMAGLGAVLLVLIIVAL